MMHPKTHMWITSTQNYGNIWMHIFHRFLWTISSIFSIFIVPVTGILLIVHMCRYFFNFFSCPTGYWNIDCKMKSNMFRAYVSIGKTTINICYHQKRQPAIFTNISVIMSSVVIGYRHQAHHIQLFYARWPDRNVFIQSLYDRLLPLNIVVHFWYFFHQNHSWAFWSLD